MAQSGEPGDHAADGSGVLKNMGNTLEKWGNLPVMTILWRKNE